MCISSRDWDQFLAAPQQLVSMSDAFRASRRVPCTKVLWKDPGQHWPSSTDWKWVMHEHTTHCIFHPQRFVKFCVRNICQLCTDGIEDTKLSYQIKIKIPKETYWIYPDLKQVCHSVTVDVSVYSIHNLLSSFVLEIFASFVQKEFEIPNYHTKLILRYQTKHTEYILI